MTEAEWAISCWGESGVDQARAFLAAHQQTIEEMTTEALRSQTLSSGRGLVSLLIEDAPGGRVTVSVGGADGFCADRRRTQTEDAALEWRERALDPNRSSSAYLAHLADRLEQETQGLIASLRDRSQQAERAEAAWR